ncbi:unnamed protein product, partial [Pylaiella littoralis]
MYRCTCPGGLVVPSLTTGCGGTGVRFPSRPEPGADASVTATPPTLSSQNPPLGLLRRARQGIVPPARAAAAAAATSTAAAADIIAVVRVVVPAAVACPVVSPPAAPAAPAGGGHVLVVVVVGRGAVAVVLLVVAAAAAVALVVVVVVVIDAACFGDTGGAKSGQGLLFLVFCFCCCYVYFIHMEKQSRPLSSSSKVPDPSRFEEQGGLPLLHFFLLRRSETFYVFPRSWDIYPTTI